MDKKYTSSKAIGGERMDERKERLRTQIEKVIVLLETRLKEEPDKPILKTLQTRYKKALEIVLDDGNVETIMIKGGCRAYLDAFSDYMNPLLTEMDMAEKLLLDYRTAVQI